MKKMMMIIICCIAFVLLLISGCSNNETEENEEVSINKELKVLVPNIPNKKGNYNYTGLEFISYFLDEYKKQSNTDVVLEVITYDDYQTYYKEDMNKLKEKKFDLLFLYKPIYPFHDNIEYDIAMNLPNQIQNADDLYEGLKDEYYIPISIAVINTPYNRKVFSKNNMEIPSYDWTIEDYKKITQFTASQSDVYLDLFLFGELYQMFLSDLDISNLGAEDILESITELEKEIYSGRYILMEGYNHTNYKNLLLNPRSVEFNSIYSLTRDHKENSLLIPEVCTFGTNLLNTVDSNLISGENMILLPPLGKSHINTGFFSYGFIVNKQTNNLEGAVDYLNYMLDENTQFELYTKYGETQRHISGYVVNSIEDEVAAFESNNNINEEVIRLREYLYDTIDSGKYSLYEKYDFDLFYGLYEPVIDIIFDDDKYTEDDKIKIIEDVINDY